MSIRKSFASALRLVRASRQLTQKDISGGVTGSHISQLESAKTSPTVKLSAELARSLAVDPIALLAVAFAAEQGVTPNQVLNQALADLEKLDLLHTVPPAEPSVLESPHPTTVRAQQVHAQVQALKAQGFRQAEVARELGLPKSTVQRNWHVEG